MTFGARHMVDPEEASVQLEMAVTQKVLQFQSLGTLLLPVAFGASGVRSVPLPLPIIGVTGVVVSPELVLLLRERLAASQLRYWFQQCVQARDSAPSGWNSASWSSGIV